MTNVISISCTCEYLIACAARHRRAGRYDEAMVLLWKARNQFGYTDEILSEMSKIYTAIGCEEEALKANLRLVRVNGSHCASALFQLSVYSAQRGDMRRAASYFDRLLQMEHPRGISSEMIDALREQLSEDQCKTHALSAKARAKMLEKRSAACLQAGRVVGAQRAIEHALRLRRTARRYTMLACCQMIRMRFDDAVISARAAYALAPNDIQNLCVLADAYLACEDIQNARQIIHTTALRAKRIDDLLSVAVESAKMGDDKLTLLLTSRILKQSPFHTHAMMLRACAYANLQRFASAKRVLGRLCGLLPENSVCESYYRMLCQGRAVSERLLLGLDVTREEGINRAAELASFLYSDPKEIDEDQGCCLRICRLAEWAFHSPMAGAATKNVALILLAALQSEEAKQCLLDALMHPQLSDSLKLHVLQVLTANSGFHPYDVDIGGKLVRLAAGAVSDKPIRSGQENSKIVQRVADALWEKEPNAANVLLDAFLRYLDTFDQPDASHENACAAALECWYFASQGKNACIKAISARYGVSPRMVRIYIRRFEACMQRNKQSQQEDSHELH